MQVTNKIQALQIWNQMNAMERMSVVQKADAQKFLKHGVKRAFDTTLLFIENNISQFIK